MARRPRERVLKEPRLCVSVLDASDAPVTTMLGYLLMRWAPVLGNAAVCSLLSRRTSVWLAEGGLAKTRMVRRARRPAAVMDALSVPRSSLVMAMPVALHLE